LSSVRTYAVGAAFSNRDVEDQFRWLPVEPCDWTNVEYRRKKPPRQTVSRQAAALRRRRASGVTSRVDPSRVRTPEQQKAVARSL